jgi:glycine/D-amino acid oxidase-like deaminating enzyme
MSGMRAVIVGAGVGGLTLALLLRQRGITAEVVEQAPELREAGAAIALASNATTRQPGGRAVGRPGHRRRARRVHRGPDPGHVLTVSLIRCGRPDLAIRFRQYTSEDGSNPGVPDYFRGPLRHRGSLRSIH